MGFGLLVRSKELNGIGPEFLNVLDQLNSGSYGYFEKRKTLEMRPTLLIEGRHSHILKVKVIFEEGSLALCLKRIKPKENSVRSRQDWKHLVEKEFSFSKTVYGAFKQYCRGIAGVRPIACFPEHLVLVMEEFAGQPLMRQIQNSGRYVAHTRSQEKLARYCYLAGKWLKRCQAITKVAEGGFDSNEFLTYMDVRLSRLVERSALPFDSRLRSTILNFIESQSRQLCEADLAISAVTGDFVPSNVLVRKQQIAVIDFGMASHGSVFQDLAQFYQHIDFFRLKPIYRQALISRLQDEFLRGYAADFDKSQPLFRLFRIRSIVNRLSATAVSKWSSLPFCVRLYNRWVWPKQLRDLRSICDA